MVVSFPALISRIRPYAPAGRSTGRTPFIPSIFPYPIFRMFGISRSGYASITWPMVLHPTSSKSAASGASPIPTLSSTIQMTLLMVSLLYLSEYE